jgi:hypothetical protein
MGGDKGRSLRQKIADEMTIDYASVLEKIFDLAKQFMRISKEGKVDVLIKDKINGKEKIILYLIGKLYAKEGGFIATDDVGNKELAEELGIPEGSLLPWLKDLRDSKKILQVKKGRYTHHSIPIKLVEKSLLTIEKKLKK